MLAKQLDQLISTGSNAPSREAQAGPLVGQISSSSCAIGVDRSS
ncbi:hypothetical protein ACQR16_11810 [Bradyrhizobium oligotrophicum]